MKVTLKKDWLGHKSGSKVIVNDPTGLRLIESDIAKVVAETPPAGHVTCLRCGAFVKLPKPAKGKVKAKEDDLISTMIDEVKNEAGESKEAAEEGSGALGAAAAEKP